MSIDARVAQLEQTNAQILTGLNTLIEKVNADEKEKSEKQVLIEERDNAKKAIIEQAEKDLEAIDEEYGPKLKALNAENDRKFYKKINSGGRSVGAILGKITKPVKNFTDGITQELS